MLKEDTFGSSPAAKVLASILNEPKMQNERKNISRIMARYGQTLNELHKVDSQIAISLAKMYTTNLIGYFDKYPPSLSTFGKNVVSYKHKVWLESIDSRVPYKNRNK